MKRHFLLSKFFLHLGAFLSANERLPKREDLKDSKWRERERENLSKRPSGGIKKDKGPAAKMTMIGDPISLARLGMNTSPPTSLPKREEIHWIL